MLVKTHQQGRRYGGDTQTSLLCDNKGQLPVVRSGQGYLPVSSMTESTVVVYYHCSSDVPCIKPDQSKMRGARRVVTFCLLTAFIPMMLLIFPLYLRNTIFVERHFSLMSDDVLSVTDGISSYFCQGHKIEALEGWFSAYQMVGVPEISSERRITVVNSSMVIPDDRLEYWGFHLLPESTITMGMCANSIGARLLVVRGEKNLELCGLLHHSTAATPPTIKPLEVPAGDEETVLVTFEQQEKKPVQIDQEEIENHGGEVTDSTLIDDIDESSTRHPIRHQRSKLVRLQRDLDTAVLLERKGVTTTDMEGAIEHGGNAADDIDKAGDSSLSSFEASLLTCFSGKTLFQKGFAANGKLCENTSNWTESLRLSHKIRSQGRFYYVFYSDNDLTNNSINIRFHINATRYDFINSTMKCDNVTECAFKLKFLGGDGIVYIEANSDVLLVSTCEPRLLVYLLFPACALLFVLIFGLL